MNNQEITESALGSVLESITDYIDNGFGKGLRSFLWQIVSNAASNEPVFISAYKLTLVSAGLRVRCAIGITFESDRWRGDRRT